MGEWVRAAGVGVDVPMVVREFSRRSSTCMRPDITPFISRTVFNSDLRGVLAGSGADVTIVATVALYIPSSPMLVIVLAYLIVSTLSPFPLVMQINR